MSVKRTGEHFLIDKSLVNEALDILVTRYAGGGERLISATDGLDDAERRQVPPANAPGDIGRWSAHQLLIHLADAETAFADRMKRIIAMDEPSLLMWDEGRFATRLHYEEQSSEDAIELIRLIRRQTSRVLGMCADEVFDRIGIHNQRGPQSLKAIVGFTDWHLDHHLEFIARKRRFFENT